MNFNFKKFLFVLFIVGLIVIVFLVFKFTNTNTNTNTNTYQFINPTVVSNLGKYYIINFYPLKKDLENIQKKYSYKTYIYFLYLNNNSWIGLNEKDEFTAASTIKVPLAMSIYKAIEDGKLKANTIYNLEDLDLDSNFGTLYKSGDGKQFTIEQLIEIMLSQSDNTAMQALFHILKNIGIDDPLSPVYEELGWQYLTPPAIGEAPNYQKINLKTLANMFLSLYNSTFLKVENSEKILKFLANTPFNDKLQAGLPKDIIISHKIGVSVPDKTFSDCGIIYAPNRNYILCVGLEGADEKTASKFMAEVSKTVYDYIINN